MNDTTTDKTAAQAAAGQGPADAASAIDPSRFVSVALGTPIKRGETMIDTLTLRKPKAGELRGLSLQDILQSDAGAIIKLVPRISDPALTEAEVGELEADDFAEIGGSLFGFFMTPAQKAAIAAMTR